MARAQRLSVSMTADRYRALRSLAHGLGDGTVDDTRARELLGDLLPDTPTATGLVTALVDLIIGPYSTELEGGNRSDDETVETPEPPTSTSAMPRQMPDAMRQLGITRERMLSTLPYDGSWICREHWQRRLGIPDVSPVMFGHAVTAADVSESAQVRNRVHYRRKTWRASERSSSKWPTRGGGVHFV